MRDFRLVQEMPMDPPHLFADWYDDNICVGGFVPTAANNDFFCVKAFKVTDNVPDKIPPRCPYEEGSVIYSFFGDHHRTMNLLVANVPQKLKKIPIDSSRCKKVQEHSQNSESDLVKAFSADFHITVAPRDHTREVNYCSKTSNNNQANSLSKSGVCDGRDLSVTCSNCVPSGKGPSADLNNPEPQACDKYMIFVTGEQHNAIAFHRVEDLPQTLEKKLKDKKVLEENVRKASGGSGAQENLAATVTRLTTPENPTKIIHFPGHYISGMKLSRDQ
ncbi:uncharacterized protein, partial [Argopecten irradians]|uniref:uncharacterized protein n=1 Tax=Argopecten irradians TaxID=31199 RepID=UPI0037103716